MHPHKLRHTFVTRALEDHNNIVNIQQWVGHANPRTTIGYAHATKKGHQELTDSANS